MTTTLQWPWDLFAARLQLDDSRQAQLLERFYVTRDGVRQLLIAPRIMPFLRGLARTHNIPDGQMPKLALGVLYVALGEWPLSNLAVGLSSTMGLPNDTAHKVAAEIEKELFAPIMLEFNKFLGEQRRGGPASAETAARQAGASNIIDLKHKSQNTEHKQFPKPSNQNTTMGTRPPRPDLPKPGEFTK